MPDKGIVVEVYKDSAPSQLVDIINGRINPTTLSELQNHGAGSFRVSKRDPKILANPSLLDYQNLIRIRVDGRIAGGFIIQTKKTVIVGEGEARDEVWEISGEGFRSGSKGASVYPFGGLKSSSKETRFFNFASEKGSWYVSSQWVNPVLWQKWNDRTHPAYGWRATAPAQWPDAPNAWWIWDRGGSGPMPQGFVYFRHTFTTSDALPQQYSLFFGVDDQADVYLDGELILTTAEHAWQETTRLDFNLTAGTHILAFKAYNYRSDGPGGLIAALFKVGDPSAPSSAQLISWTGKSGADWKICPYPAEEPGWTVGQILTTLLNEAKARGVRFANNVSLGFSELLDSDGNTWPRVSRSFTLGSSYSDVFESLEELDCDLYLDPDTYILYAYKKKGYSRPNVQFVPGKNLIQAEETGQANLANTVMLRTSEGWVEKTPTDSTSLTKYGRLEAQMATELTAAGADSLTAEIFRQKALPEKSATFTIIPFPGAVPLVDFNIGDYVMAPGEAPGVLESRRVMSISLTEDEKTGFPIYAVEFDTIFKDRQSELERWVSRSTNSSALGAGFANSAPNPSTVIQAQPAPVIRNIPDAPTGVSASAVARWDANGTAVADVSLSWNPVISSGSIPITDVESYEVWGNIQGQTATLLTSVYDTAAFFPSLEAGKTWQFGVIARSRTAGGGPMSDLATITLPTPTAPLAAPSAPTLTSSLGVVSIVWDGKLGGTDAPNHYRYMVVQRKPVASGSFADVTSFTSTAGQDANVLVGSQYSYRLIPVDSLGIRGEASAAASITVEGVGTAELEQTIIDAIQDAQDAANQAQSTADGKTTISPNAPVVGDGAGKPVGALWWRRDASTGNVIGMWEWSGTAWASRPTGADAIANGAIIASKLGNGAVDSTKLSPAVNTAISTAQSSADAAALAASAAQTTANGKSRVVRSSSAASSPASFSTGDQWWQVGSGNQVIAMWLHNGSGWIPQTLTDSVITNLNAGTITAGTLSADRIGANSITGDKIVANTITSKNMILTNFSNLVENGGFEYGSAGWTLGGSGAAVSTTVKRSGAYSLTATAAGNTSVLATQATSFAVDGTGTDPERYRFGAWVYNASATTVADEIWLQANWSTTTEGGTYSATAKISTGSYSSGTAAGTWTYVTGVWTVPGAAKFAKLRLVLDGAATTGNIFYIDDVSITRMADASLIVDGAITASKVKANSITANEMATGTITAASGVIGDAAITTAKIADLAVTDAKIANINAGKITAGYVNAARIEAGSITASKLTISNLSNLIEDPGFEYGNGWTASSTTTRVSTAPRTGSWHLSINTTGALQIRAAYWDAIPVEEGQVYEFSFWSRTESGTSPANTVGAAIRYGATSSVSTGVAVAGGGGTRPEQTTTYQYTNTRYTVGAGIKFIRPEIRIEAGATGTIYVDDAALVRRVDGSLVVDGTITGVKLNAAEIWSNTAWIDVLNTGKITTNMVTSNFGASINLDTNGAITFLTGQQAATNDALSTAVNNIEGLGTNLSATNEAVGAAQGTADSANSAAESAQSAAAGAQAAVSAMGQFYRFDANAAVIGRVGDPTELRLQNNEIGIYQNNSRVTWWNAGQFFVTSMVVQEAQIGNHLIQKFGSTRTVFRKA